MKLFALGLLGAAVAIAIGATSARTPQEPTMIVGNRPGDIGKFGEPADLVKAAKARGHEVATYGGGCFWGIESRFRKTPGVIATAVGYIGGHVDSPTYQEVCLKTTGHAEAILVEYDPKVISHLDLTRRFFGYHNPTQLNRQGPDIGPNYRSHIFTYGPDQEKNVKAVIAEIDASGKWNGKVVTQVSPAVVFWMAEEYHQQYNEKNGFEACPIDH